MRTAEIRYATAEIRYAGTEFRYAKMEFCYAKTDFCYAVMKRKEGQTIAARDQSRVEQTDDSLMPRGR